MEYLCWSVVVSSILQLYLLRFSFWDPCVERKLAWTNPTKSNSIFKLGRRRQHQNIRRSLVEEDVSWNCPDLTVCHVGDHLFFPFAVCKIPTKATTFVSWWKVHNFYASVKNQDLTNLSSTYPCCLRNTHSSITKHRGKDKFYGLASLFGSKEVAKWGRLIQISNVVFDTPTPQTPHPSEVIFMQFSPYLETFLRQELSVEDAGNWAMLVTRLACPTSTEKTRRSEKPNLLSVVKMMVIWSIFLFRKWWVKLP